MKRFALLAALSLGGISMIAAQPALAQLSINVSVGIAPPPLPIYEQPPIPGPDYIWAPGYWAWDDDVQDYFWVPGTWVLAPRPGLLWTPPWWGWQDGVYAFHTGYWGPHVGFYGGVAYGFGYTGVGFEGARWVGGHVSYNSSVTNIRNVHITNVYNKTVIINRTVNNISYNGGPGGVRARPSPAQLAVIHEPHIPPLPVQAQHFQAARRNRQFFVAANHGRPPVAATMKPAQFHGPGVVAAARAIAYHPPTGLPPSRQPGHNPPAAASVAAVHAGQRQPSGQPYPHRNPAALQAQPRPWGGSSTPYAAHNAAVTARAHGSNQARYARGAADDGWGRPPTYGNPPRSGQLPGHPYAGGGHPYDAYAAHAGGGYPPQYRPPAAHSVPQQPHHAAPAPHPHPAPARPAPHPQPRKEEHR